MNTRTESDAIGQLEVPEKAYYGVQSLRAAQNFAITGRKLHPLMIRSLTLIKKAAALANRRAGRLEPRIADAILLACDEILTGRLQEEFVVDPIQGGAGTSANMNTNEVIANRAIELLGGKKGDYALVHPNDQVNMSQSTNDVFPTAGKMAALYMLRPLLYQLERLHSALEDKGTQFQNIVKMGRTQLQDAVPIRLGQSFQAYAGAVQRDIRRLQDSSRQIAVVNMGGTAIGTALNVPAYYLDNIVPLLCQVSGLELTQADDLIDATQNLDGLVSFSAAVKTCAVNLSKCCDDLRLLSSGPRTGIGEINLPARQNGSSIMPGKVNPVIPEVVTQVAFHCIGNDAAITMAAQAGQLELNAFEPVLFDSLFSSLTTLTGAVQTLVDNCVLGITANPGRCQELLERSVGTVTAMVPYIGYKRSAEIAKEALKKNLPVRQILAEKTSFSPQELDRILNPLSMTTPDGAASQDVQALKLSSAAG